MDWLARGIGIRVGGHRGSPVLAPENTWASFETALDDGVDYVETDIRRTKDGTLVLMHDATLDRTTDGSGDVEDIGTADLARLDAGTWFGDVFRGQRVPSLTDFIRWIEEHPPMGAALEVKAAGIGGEVARLAAASPARDRFAIYSFHPGEIRAARKAAQRIPSLLLLRLTDDPAGVMAAIEDCGADGADVPWQWNARSLLDRMREAGMLLGGGTASGADAAQRLVDLRVDVIDTDRAPELIAAIRAAGGMGGSVPA